MKTQTAIANGPTFMKTTKYLVFTIILLTHLTICSAQTIPSYELSFQNPRLIGSVYQFDIFVKSTGAGSFRLGNSQFIVNFNSSDFTSPALARVASSEQTGTGFFFDQYIGEGKLFITLGGNGSYTLAEDVSATGAGTRISTYQISGVSVPEVSPQLGWVNPPELLRTGISAIDNADNYYDITDLTGTSHIDGGGEFGKISGYAFNDLNGDGLWNQPAEQPLNGWTITLQGIEAHSAVTGSGTWLAGYYEFINLPPGVYAIDEVAQANWSKTASPTNPVSVASGDDLQNYNFGNYNGPAIIGALFNDKYGNGSKETGDPALSGWTVTATRAGGGGLKTALTNIDGSYSFVFTPSDAGDWVIAQTLQAGWVQTLPAGSQNYTFTVQSGSYEANVDFGNFRGCEVAGQKFNDFNRDSLKESFESFMSGWKIMLMKNGTHYDSVLTGVDGGYSFSSLLPGSYAVMEDSVTGWSQTVPAPPGYYTFSVDTGGLSLTGKDFGNFHIMPLGGIGTIMGRKFQDMNQNGARDPEDAGIENWTIYLSIGNFLIDSALTDINGDYLFQELEDGIYKVSEKSSLGWAGTFPAGGTGYYELEIGPAGRLFADKDFGNFRFGRISGTVYNDVNHNGNKDTGEPGLAGIHMNLAGQSVNLEIVTLAGGAWSFQDLPAGNYTLNESVPGGYHITEPVQGSYTVEIVSGSELAGMDFGNSVLTDTVKFRTICYDSLAYERDNKGKLGKSVKRKNDKVEFRFFIVNNTGVTVPGLHLHITPMLISSDTNYRFTVTPEPDDIKFNSVKNHRIDIIWSDSLRPGDTVTVSGWGSFGRTARATYAWALICGNKHYAPVFAFNQPRLPMPNRLNSRDELYKNGGFGPEGLLIGVREVQYEAGWVRLKTITSMQNSFINKMVIHSRIGTGFDFFASARVFKKEQKSLTPQKQNNRLFADAAALKLNIAASELQMIPAGIGELIFDDGVNPLSGLSLRAIAAKADTVLTYCWDHLPWEYVNLDTTIRQILQAFEGPVDTISFGQRLMFSGVRRLIDVPFLRALAGVQPVTREPAADSGPLYPETFQLYQNYPNPFNPVTAISFDLPEEMAVTLKLFNVLGQQVTTLLDQEIMDEGNRDLEFDLSILPSGVYFYRLEGTSLEEPARSCAKVMKMTLLK